MTKPHVEVVNVRELARNTSRVLEGVEEGAFVLVTRNGKPVATVTPISPDALDDFVLAHAPEFVQSREEAEQEITSDRTASLADFAKELDRDGAAQRE